MQGRNSLLALLFISSDRDKIIGRGPIDGARSVSSPGEGKRDMHTIGTTRCKFNDTESQYIKIIKYGDARRRCGSLTSSRCMERKTRVDFDGEMAEKCNRKRGVKGQRYASGKHQAENLGMRVSSAGRGGIASAYFLLI